MPQQPTVLVVDDQLGARELLQTILQSDYRVVVAKEGEQAIYIVEHEPMDVILLDLHMPGLSGRQVLQKIQAIVPSIQVILVTGSDPYATVLEDLRPHIFDYMLKSFDVSSLRETVKQALAHRSQ